MTQAESELDKLFNKFLNGKPAFANQAAVMQAEGFVEYLKPKLEALITDQVREELKKIEQIGADPKFDTPAHLAPIYSVRAYIKDRLAQLTEKGKEDERTV